MQYQGATEETPDENRDVPALGPKHPPTHWVHRAPFPAIKWQGGGLTIHCHLRPSGAIRVLPHIVPWRTQHNLALPVLT
jgi:hypothetical protein